MDSLLGCLLAAIFAATPLTEMPSEEIQFAKMPKECAAEYVVFLRQERNADSTDVIQADLDGDGLAEMLVWTGISGSSGEEWSVMRHNGRGYVRAGQVFGRLFLIHTPEHKGLLVCNPCGWAEAAWTFYQLRSGKLEETLELQIRYSRPIRERATQITILYQKEETEK